MATTYTQRQYTESDAVKQARAALEQQAAQKPGTYQSQWQAQLSQVMDKILNREDFSYDLNGDALYQQYKDQYVRQGKLAMMDTMGQAAALTGGYGNSYAQSVGQQTYQGYLQGLNDKIPELYQLALDRYNQRGQDLYNQYSLLGAQEAQDYSRYQDAVSAWNTERSYLADQYAAERGYDYDRYRDLVADDQWLAEFDFAMQQYLDSLQAASSGGQGGGSAGAETAETTESGPTGTYTQLFKDLKMFTDQGATKIEVSRLVQSAVAAGNITEHQAQALLSWYIPKAA